ncbi:ribonuclease D [Aestuariibacter salexigens]|uniref:ribonuclease D n=1 Tax=Aestuariibacter salexigens TaxID=226010 RepID=UPI000401393D|nr:ribonuclease D [Aestuariibacter salexigens]
MHYTLVTSFQQLSQVCEQAQQSAMVALDTEFVRTRTYYPALGLVQLYDGQTLSLIDPLAIDDLTPLCDLLTNNNVIKVLHSCSEDLETFLHALSVVPTPIFDTQFAAGLLNMGPSLGYARLVELMLDVSLDKGESRTDWLARPLTDKQLHYAANDVEYLFALTPTLLEQIDALGRRQWVFQEMAQLAEKKRAQLPDEFAYLSVKNNWRLQGESLLLLKLIAGWRARQARERNLALNFVLKESAMLEVATKKPAHRGALYAMEILNAHEARRHGDTLLQFVASARQAPEQDYPPRVRRLNDINQYKKTMQAIRQYCIDVAERESLSVEMLASKKQINQLLKWCWFELDETRLSGISPDLISGWRKTLLQAGLENILGKSLNC